MTNLLTMTRTLTTTSTRQHDKAMSIPPDSDYAILRAEHLGRSVKEKILVQDASFELKRGEFLAISGPSGSGKSSLLRLLNRLDEPTTGTVFVEGVDYRNLQPRDLRRKLGMVSQRPYLFPGTVADNLRFGPAQRGETLPQEAVDSLLSQVLTFPEVKHSGFRWREPWLIRHWCFCSTSPHRHWMTPPNLKLKLPSKRLCATRA
jgi:ABC-type multidrug transport system fused ATPase/permease subunit